MRSGIPSRRGAARTTATYRTFKNSLGTHRSRRRRSTHIWRRGSATPSSKSYLSVVTRGSHERQARGAALEGAGPRLARAALPGVLSEARVMVVVPDYRQHRI